MNKAIGAAAILLGCFAAALLRMRAKRTRIEALLSLRAGLAELRRALSERRHALREIFLRLADRYEARPAGEFFHCLSQRMDALGECCFVEIWEAALRDKLAFLGEEVSDTLGALGLCLGGSELELQCRALERASADLDAIIQRDRDALPAEKRMSYGLSLCAGAMLLIMLI